VLRYITVGHFFTSRLSSTDACAVDVDCGNIAGWPQVVPDHPRSGDYWAQRLAVDDKMAYSGVG